MEEVRWLPGQVGDADVMHHANGTVPPRSRRPILLTIHDLQYLALPQYFSFARRAYLAAAVPRSVRNAVAITVPSEFVRATVVNGFSVDPSRVLVVPHGLPPLTGADREGERVLRERYGLGERRILIYPAMTYPHKNHRFLINLLAGPLASEDFVLVLTGARARSERALLRLVRSLGVLDRVVRTGRVPDADRNGLVSIAHALVFPSQYEGFGAPVLEAMALGTPVITSDQAALPEVAGDGGLITPLDLDAWADAVRRIEHERDRLVARGRARALLFTADNSARIIAGAYRQVADSTA
jgi:glycosyltransferase involved in cell wall biosynthesis